MRLHRSKARHRRSAVLSAEERERAEMAADESLARAEADHAREDAALGRESGAVRGVRQLAASVRQIREDNHFSGIIAAAFRGDE